MKLYKEASLMMLPTSVKDGKLYSIFPQPKPLSGELVTNGEFDTDSDWTKGTGWDITGGKAVFSGIDFASLLPESSFLTIGKTYKLSLTAVVTNGSFKVQHPSSNDLIEESESGSYVVTFIATSNTFSIARASVGQQNDFSIDNISVVEVDQLPADFDFSRGADRATRVNEQGLVRPVEIVSDELVQNGDFEEVGDELVTNGGFDTDSDWSKVNATISGGEAVVNVVSGAFSYISQNISYTSSRVYRVEIQVQGTSGYNIRFQDNANNLGDFFEIITLDGTKQSFSYYFTANANSDTIQISRHSSSGDYSFSIDNISVKEVGQNWEFGTGWSYEDGKAVCDGTNITYLTQVAILTTGKSYKVQFDIVDYTSGSVKYRDNGLVSGQSFSGANSYTDYVIAGGGQFRLMSENFTGSIDNISVVEVTEATDLPRLDWSGDCPVLLLEPQRTNLIEYSEDFSQWQNGGGTQTIVANSTTSPQGLQNASSIQIDSGYVYKQVSGLSVLSGDKYTWSCYVNSASQKITFGGGSVAGTDVYSSEDSGNGWYRQKLTRTFTTSGSIIQPMFLDSISGTDLFYIWGAQLEEGSYPTSYIPTRGQSATRAADDCSVIGISDLIGQTEGTLFVEANLSDVDSSTQRGIAELNDGGTLNRITLFRNYNGTIRLYVRNGGTAQMDATYSTPPNGATKIAIAYTSNDIVFYVNGSLVASDSSATIPACSDLDVGQMEGNLTKALGDSIKQVLLFKTRLSDNECINLTTI